MMKSETVRELATTVQYNCHVSDARHGGDYSLCVYLMKMREYYRWEHHLPYGAFLEKDRVGDWLAAREQLWEELESAELQPLMIDGERFDPFDSERINARLEPQGLVYSGGLGNRSKPHFFLGDLESHERNGEYSVFVVAGEYARDLTAPPAMTRDQCIFVRRESLRRMLWEKLEGWRWSRPDNALGRAIACYDFEGALDVSLDAMTDREIESVLLHERGEYEAGLLLGEDWNRMLMDLAETPAEIMARAVRDHLADCIATLPVLAGDGDAPRLHFYMGNLTSMRKEIFPGLERAYDTWLQSGDLQPLMAVAELGAAHWEELARRMMAIHQEAPEAATRRIQALVCDSYL
jgi:hypothetical protein